MFTTSLKDIAKRALADCSADEAFWCHNGNIVRNIYELRSALESMDLVTFIYHVNDDNNKNDFARWIFEVLGDEALATSLRFVKDRDEYVSIISRRIDELELS